MRNSNLVMHILIPKPLSYGIIWVLMLLPVHHKSRLLNRALMSLDLCYARSGLLDSEAIVEFVRALCHVAQEELRPAAAPRVYSLTKIVEISHFNMSRIRYSHHQWWHQLQACTLLECSTTLDILRSCRVASSKCQGGLGDFLSGV